MLGVSLSDQEHVSLLMGASQGLLVSWQLANPEVHTVQRTRPAREAPNHHVRRTLLLLPGAFNRNGVNDRLGSILSIVVARRAISLFRHRSHNDIPECGLGVGSIPVTRLRRCDPGRNVR